MGRLRSSPKPTRCRSAKLIKFLNREGREESQTEAVLCVLRVLRGKCSSAWRGKACRTGFAVLRVFALAFSLRREGAFPPLGSGR